MAEAEAEQRESRQGARASGGSTVGHRTLGHARPDKDSPGSQCSRFTRSTADKWIGGVCGGIAEYFGWSPGLVRLLSAVSCVLPGPVPDLSGVVDLHTEAVTPAVRRPPR